MRAHECLSKVNLEELEHFINKFFRMPLHKQKKLNHKVKVSTKLLKGRAADKIVEYLTKTILI